MSKLWIALILCPFLCLGCADADIDAKADTDVNTNIKTEVDSFLKANLESLVKAQIDAKVQGIGDIKANLADEIKADIKAQITQELETKIQAAVANTTQNTGMFSGGAIYVVILAIVFLVLLFGSFIWLIKSLMKWKNIWHLLSESIEKYSHVKEHECHVKKIKSHFAAALKSAGLKNVVDNNLKKRGIVKDK